MHFTRDIEFHVSDFIKKNPLKLNPQCIHNIWFEINRKLLMHVKMTTPGAASYDNTCTTKMVPWVHAFHNKIGWRRETGCRGYPWLEKPHMYQRPQYSITCFSEAWVHLHSAILPLFFPPIFESRVRRSKVSNKQNMAGILLMDTILMLRSTHWVARNRWELFEPFLQRHGPPYDDSGHWYHICWFSSVIQGETKQNTQQGDMHEAKGKYKRHKSTHNTVRD